jgi:anti-sigma regulatory factor (Ser/Thr protein kinase)
MKPSVRYGCELWQTLAAVPSAVEEFCIEFRRHAEKHLDRPHRFAAELLVREALNNAVVHGCRSDPGNRFRCALRLGVGRLTIAVIDDGDGFDWRAVLRRRNDNVATAATAATAATTAASGRGLGILFRYATRVRFNEKGNAVTVVKRF